MQLHLIDDLWEPTGTLDIIFLAVWGVILIAMAALGLVNLVKRQGGQSHEHER